MTSDEQDTGGITRRKALKRLGAGAVVAWAAPVVTSFRAPAYAGSSIPGSCHLVASLDAGQEVPPRSSPATGTADLSINTQSRVVHYTYTFKDLTAFATAARVHHAPQGVNGPVVITLANPPRSRSGAVTGVLLVSPELAADLCANPTNYYINITSAVFTDGEIRGQMKGL